MLYATGFGKGVFKSSDNGRTWALKNDGITEAHPFAWRLTQAKEGRPDVIVTDIMMPRRSGLEMLADLKADGALAEIPVILLSAKAQTADVRAGLEAGAADYITKPFEPLDLLERVQRVLAS